MKPAKSKFEMYKKIFGKSYHKVCFYEIESAISRINNSIRKIGLLTGPRSKLNKELKPAISSLNKQLNFLLKEHKNLSLKDLENQEAFGGRIKQYRKPIVWSDIAKGFDKKTS
jgi:hypothetical protein